MRRGRVGGRYILEARERGVGEEDATTAGCREVEGEDGGGGKSERFKKQRWWRGKRAAGEERGLKE